MNNMCEGVDAHQKTTKGVQSPCSPPSPTAPRPRSPRYPPRPVRGQLTHPIRAQLIHQTKNIHTAWYKLAMPQPNHRYHKHRSCDPLDGRSFTCSTNVAIRYPDPRGSAREDTLITHIRTRNKVATFGNNDKIHSDIINIVWPRYHVEKNVAYEKGS